MIGAVLRIPARGKAEANAILRSAGSYAPIVSCLPLCHVNAKSPLEKVSYLLSSRQGVGDAPADIDTAPIEPENVLSAVDRRFALQQPAELLFDEALASIDLD